MRRLTWLVAVTTGCTANPEWQTLEYGACQIFNAPTSNNDRFVVTEVFGEEREEGVVVQIIGPTESTWLPDGAPVVVAVAGGISTDYLPLSESDRMLNSGRGFVQVVPNLPGGEGPAATTGANDYRGADSRAALHLALRYAANEIEDEDGCFLADRLHVPISSIAPLLHGQSNGGNLAVSLLADVDRDLPELSGLITFEVPAGAQFIAGEFGPEDQILPSYEEGLCSWDTASGIVCDFDYGVVGWDDNLSASAAGTETLEGGAAYYDIDEDGTHDALFEPVIAGLRPRIEDETRMVVSSQFASVLRSLEPIPEIVLSAEDALEFWATRDAGRRASAAVDAHPDLKAIIIGTDNDHRQPIPDHPHISGLAWALYASGAYWVRVNPDDAYVERFTGQPGSWTDNDANSVSGPGDPTQLMEPESSEASSRGLVTAAAMELADRTYWDDWSVNLTATIGE